MNRERERGKERESEIKGGSEVEKIIIFKSFFGQAKCGEMKKATIKGY